VYSNPKTRPIEIFKHSTYGCSSGSRRQTPSASISQGSKRIRILVFARKNQ